MSGSVAELAADDDSYFVVRSTTEGDGLLKSVWQATFSSVPNDITSLHVSYKGKNSRECAQSVKIRNFTTNLWVKLAFATVGPTEVALEGSPSGNLADYVSGSGEVWVKVVCKGARAFTASADLLQITYQP